MKSVKVSAQLKHPDINLTVNRGEILGLLGENGAGKTTLMNILTGLYKPDSGSILIDNQLKVFIILEKQIKMVGMVHQHFMLVPVFSVTENIILGTEPTTTFNKIDLTITRKVLKISSEYNLDVDPNQLIEKLPVGIQQRVEIIKILFEMLRF